MTDPIVKSIDVPCSPERAFDIFVTRISNWWPLDKHAVSAATGNTAKEITIEPRVGGSVYETMYDGRRSDWGKVLEFVPGEVLAMTWHPGTNVDNPTHLHVGFAEAGPGKTRVTLTHSGWEVWADKADDMRGGYNNGWNFVLECFSWAAEATPT